MKTEIVNVRVSNNLLKKIDKILQEKSFNSRSEAIRHFIREHINEEKNKKKLNEDKKND